MNGAGGKISGTVIFKQKDHSIPDAFLKKAIEANPTFFGVAYVEDGKLQHDEGDGFEDFKDAKGYLDVLKENNVFLHLGFDPNGKTEGANIQPYTVEDENQNVFFAIMIDGEFSQVADPAKPKNGTQWNLFKEAIGPYLTKLSAAAHDDTTKVVKEFLTDTDTKLLLEGLFKEGRGTIVIINAKGESFYLPIGNSHQEYSWGWASNNHGYVEEVGDPPKATVTSLTSKLALQRLKKTVGLPPEETEEKKENTPPLPDKVVQAAHHVLENVSKDDEFEESEEMVAPPKGLSNKAVKSWYAKHLGKAPAREVWRDRQPIKIKVKKKKGSAVADTSTPITQRPESTKPVHSHNHAGSTVGPDVVAKVKEYLVSIKGQEIDPDDIEEALKKTPSFAEMLGLNGLEETFPFTPEALDTLCEKWPKLASRLLQDYRLAYFIALGSKSSEEPVVVPSDEEVEENRRMAAEQSSPDKPVTVPDKPVVHEDVSAKPKKISLLAGLKRAS